MFPLDKLSKLSSGRVSDPWNNGDNCDRFDAFQPVELDDNKEPTIFDIPPSITSFTRSSFNATLSRTNHDEPIYAGNRNRSSSVSAIWGNYREGSNARQTRNYSVVEADWGPSDDDQALYESASRTIFDQEQEQMKEEFVVDEIDWKSIYDNSTRQEELDSIDVHEKDRNVSVATDWSSYSGDEIANHYYDLKPLPEEFYEAAHWSSDDN